jgi:hypothetical protein
LRPLEGSTIRQGGERRTGSGLEYVKEGMAGAGVLFVGEGADDGAEEHGGSEAGDEEAADVALVEAVLAVEVVDVGALQPVPGCTNPSQPSPFRTTTAFADLNEERNKRREGGRTHHEGVDEDVVVLEGVEGGGGGDAVLAALAELEPRHDGGQRAEHDVVEHLHGRPRRRSPEGGRPRTRGGSVARCGAVRCGAARFPSRRRFIRARAVGLTPCPRGGGAPSRAERVWQWSQPLGYLSVRAPNLRPGRTCTYCWVGKPHSVQVSSRTNQKYIYHELENIKMEAPCYIHGPNTSTWRKKNLKRQYGVQFNK